MVEPSLGYKKEVFCDQLTDGGGWTLFLRNRYGNISFNKGWIDYKNGFGDLDYDFWIGNDFLFKTTSLYNLHESNTTHLNISLLDKANSNLIVNLFFHGTKRILILYEENHHITLYNKSCVFFKYMFSFLQ